MRMKGNVIRNYLFWNMDKVDITWANWNLWSKGSICRTLVARHKPLREEVGESSLRDSKELKRKEIKRLTSVILKKEIAVS